MKRGRKPKSSFYHARIKAGLNEERACEILGVTQAVIKRFDLKGSPIMAERLILLWDKKHINAEGWQEWTFSRGALIHKNLRFTPHTLIEHQRNIDLLLKSQAEIKKLKSWKGVLKTIAEKLM